MNKLLFIIRMYVSRFLVVTLLMYVYLANACPSCEGTLKKTSPAFFAEEIENADEAQDTFSSSAAISDKAPIQE